MYSSRKNFNCITLSITGRNKVKILPKSKENFAYHHHHYPHHHNHENCSSIPYTRSCNNLLENYKLLNLPSSGNSIYPIINTSWLLFHMHFVLLGYFQTPIFFVKKKVGIDHKCLFLRFCLIFEHFSQCKHKSRLLTFSVSSLDCGFIFSNNISFIY